MIDFASWPLVEFLASLSMDMESLARVVEGISGFVAPALMLPNPCSKAEILMARERDYRAASRMPKGLVAA